MGVSLKNILQYCIIAEISSEFFHKNRQTKIKFQENFCILSLGFLLRQIAIGEGRVRLQLDNNQELMLLPRR